MLGPEKYGVFFWVVSEVFGLFFIFVAFLLSKAVKAHECYEGIFVYRLLYEQAV